MIYGWLTALALAQEAAPRERVVTVSVAPVTDAGELVLAARLVDADERVAWFLSVVGPGDGPCPAWLGGECLDLVDAVELGESPVDQSGVARHEVTVPLPPGTETVWVQAVLEDARGELTRSPVERRPVWDAAVVWDGDLVVTDRADLADAMAWQAVGGSLLVDATALEELELPDLVAVGGEVRVWENDELELVALPALERVGEGLSLYDADRLPTLSLPSLSAVGGTLSLNRLEGLTRVEVPVLEQAGGLYVFHDPLLERLRLPSLQRVAGPVELWELYDLHTVRMPSLVQVQGKLDLFEAPALTRLTAPRLEEVGGFEVHQCDALSTAGWLPSLRVVGGAWTLKYADHITSVALPSLEKVGALTALDVPALTEWSLPSLATVGGELRVERTGLVDLALYGVRTAGSLTVRDNPSLADIGLESVAVDGTVRVLQNPALSSCEVSGWIDELGHAAVACGGNLDDGCTDVCVP